MNQNRPTSLRLPAAAPAQGYEIPPPPPHTTCRWVSPQESIVIQGVRLQGGNIFIQAGPGGDLRRVPDGVVDTVLRVVPTRGPSSRYGYAYGFGYGYGDEYGYASQLCRAYAELEASERYRYLFWLAEGRPVNQDTAQFLMLFMVGLERRIILDILPSKVSAQASKEVRDVLNDIREKTRHWSSRVGEYAGRLLYWLNFAKWLREPLYQREPWFEMRPSQGITAVGAIAAHQAVSALQPLPAKWAFALAMDTEVYDTSEIYRFDKFQALFEHRYQEAYPNGLVLAGVQSELSLIEPMGRSYTPDELAPYQIQDMRASRTLKRTLRLLIEQCRGELQDYEAYVRRSRDDTGGIFLLPGPLLPEAVRAAMTEFTSKTEKVQYFVTTYAEILRPFGIAKALSRKGCGQLARFLMREGLALEPCLEDEETIAPALGHSVCLFNAKNASSWEKHESQFYYRRLVELFACVIRAEGREPVVNTDEMRAFVAEYAGLWNVDSYRLSALFLAKLVTPSTLRRHQWWLERLDEDSRRIVATYVLELLKLLPKEPGSAVVKTLMKLYKQFNWDDSQLYADLHAGRSTITQQKKGADGHHILDEVRLEKLRTETSNLRETLGKVYAENEQNDTPFDVNPDRVTVKSGPGQLALDEKHQTFVSRLIEKRNWTRSEAKELAAAQGLFFEGALEAINESTLNLWDALLLEGEDPIEVNVEIAGRLA